MNDPALRPEPRPGLRPEGRSTSVPGAHVAVKSRRRITAANAPTRIVSEPLPRVQAALRVRRRCAAVDARQRFRQTAVIGASAHRASSRSRAVYLRTRGTSRWQASRTSCRATPDILSGTPVFVGTRVPVQSLFDYLEAGDVGRVPAPVPVRYTQASRRGARVRARPAPDQCASCVDENLLHDLVAELAGHEISTVQGWGWSGVKNGELLRRTAGQIDAPPDDGSQNWNHQHDMSGAAFPS